MKNKIIESGVISRAAPELDLLDRLVLDFCKVNRKASKREIEVGINYIMMAFCIGLGGNKRDLNSLTNKERETRVRRVDKIGNTKDFKSMLEASRQLNINVGGISASVNRGVKYKGCYWEKI